MKIPHGIGGDPRFVNWSAIISKTAELQLSYLKSAEKAGMIALALIQEMAMKQKKNEQTDIQGVIEWHEGNLKVLREKYRKARKAGLEQFTITIDGTPFVFLTDYAMYLIQYLVRLINGAGPLLRIETAEGVREAQKQQDQQGGAKP
jgi:hypothetical protein